MGKPPPADPQLKCDASGLFFQWRAVEGAKHYRYRLIGENGKRLLQARTADTSASLGAGDAGQNYTAKVRVKVKNGISSWASAQAKCPAPSPDVSFTFTVSRLTHESAVIDWSYQNMPAATIEAFISMYPETDDTCDGHSETLGKPFEADKWASRYYYLCPDTSYYWAFRIVNGLGYLEMLGQTLFRTLPEPAP